MSIKWKASKRWRLAQGRVRVRCPACNWENSEELDVRTRTKRLVIHCRRCKAFLLSITPRPEEA